MFNINDAITASIGLNKSMNLLDFGSGTGLLLETIAPLVEGITAMDISRSMNKQLEEKRAVLKCDL